MTPGGTADYFRVNYTEAADAAQGDAMALSDTSRATSRAVVDAFRRIAPEVIHYLDEPHADDL
jgi:hypothetical protein